MPAISACPPAAATPAATAASSISPDSRVSRMIRTWGVAAGDHAAAARPSPSARSAVRNSPTRPRTPSVPNSRRAESVVPIGRLALRELRALARLLQSGLLALLGARVTGQEAAPLQLAAQVGIRLYERASYSVPES